MLLSKIIDYIRPDTADGALKSRVPIGFTGQGCIWYTDTAPAGWLICDGSQVNIDDYPDLFELLGSTWGTATSTQFYLPDMRQRVPVGKHSSGTFNALNNTGGAETVNAQHTHAFTTNLMSSLTSGVALASGGNNVNHRHTGVTDNSATPGIVALNILQPYNVVNFIIKT